MPLDNTEQAYFERQVTLARAILAALSLVALLGPSPPPPIFAALSLVALLETSTAPVRKASVGFLLGYLILALIAVLIGRFGDVRFQIPLTVDFLALALFLYLTPSVSA